MDGSQDTKKRRADDAAPGSDPTCLPARQLTAADLNALIDRRVAAQVKQAVDEESSSLRSAVKALQDEARDLRRKYGEAKLMCEALGQAIQVLRKDVSWTYSAPVIPDSHWIEMIERGHDETAVEEIVVWVDSFKNRTQRLRDGDVGELVGDCQYYNDSGDEMSTTLRHDDLFLPYWQEFSDAIALQREGARIGLYLHHVQLDQSVIDILGPSLTMKLNGLFLKKNMFEGKQGLKFAIAAVQNNPLMENFSWAGNQIGAECEKEAEELISLLSSHQNLTAVSLSGRGGNILRYTSACPFFNANNRRETLDLSDNALETDGGTEISDYIAANTPLFELNLSGNKLNDEDVALIAQALWKNSNLRYLYLYSNEFTQGGFEPLESAVVGGSTFNSKYSCNHTCKIHTSGYGITHKLESPINSMVIQEWKIGL